MYLSCCSMKNTLKWVSSLQKNEELLTRAWRTPFSWPGGSYRSDIFPAGSAEGKNNRAELVEIRTGNARPRWYFRCLDVCRRRQELHSASGGDRPRFSGSEPDSSESVADRGVRPGIQTAEGLCLRNEDTTGVIPQ